MKDGFFQIIRAILALISGILLSNPIAAQPIGPPGHNIDLQIPASDGVQLSGTLSLPEGSGPFPAIIFAPGSGQQPRQHIFSSIEAIRFLQAGYAILIADKRGVGGTPGEYDESRPLELDAEDILSQVRFLRG